MQVRSLGGKDLLEEGMATRPSILAWRIPYTEDPGGLQSTRLQRAGHDCSNLACMRAWMHVCVLSCFSRVWLCGWFQATNTTSSSMALWRDINDLLLWTWKSWAQYPLVLSGGHLTLKSSKYLDIISQAGTPSVLCLPHSCVRSSAAGNESVFVIHLLLTLSLWVTFSLHSKTTEPSRPSLLALFPPYFSNIWIILPTRVFFPGTFPWSPLVKSLATGSFFAPGTTFTSHNTQDDILFVHWEILSRLQAQSSCPFSWTASGTRCQNGIQWAQYWHLRLPLWFRW